MTLKPISALAIAIPLAFALSACQPASDSPANDAAAEDSAVEAGVEAARSVATDRKSKAQMQTEFNQALAAAGTTSGPGAPAMWKLSDEDTEIYLFGTVHLLRPDLVWRTAEFDQAISSADKIVFEVDMKSEDAIRAVTTDYFQRGMFADGRTLTSVLNEEDEAVVSAAVDTLGVPISAMNTFEPWMASVNLVGLKLTNDGFDPASGGESVIEAEAVAAGKSFGYLETISQQTDAFDLLPEEEQITMLYETAVLLDESPQMLDLLVEEWADGDVTGIGTLVANPDGVGFTDAAYQSLLVKRNQNWVPQIEAMRDSPGSIFIAVGAGHLAGPDSVVTMLRDKGYTIEGPYGSLPSQSTIQSSICSTSSGSNNVSSLSVRPMMDAPRLWIRVLSPLIRWCQSGNGLPSWISR